MNRDFFQIYTNDLKNSLIKKKIFYTIIIISILFFILQLGINRYKLYQKDAKDFLENEKIAPHIFPNYTQYGTHGIHLLMLPSPQTSMLPISIMYIAYLDSGSKLNIFADLQQNGIISNMMGFAGALILIIMFLSIYQGVKTFRNRDASKFYVSISSRIVFWSIFFSRLTQIFMLLLGILLLSICQLLINGVMVKVGIILFFSGMLIMGCIFYFIIGIIFGKYLSKAHTIISILFYFFSLFLIPGFIDGFFCFHGKSFKTKLDNMILLTHFQKRFDKEYGKFKSGKPGNQQVKDLIESGQRVEYTKMRAGEKKLLNKYELNTKRKHFIAALFPPSFIVFAFKETSGYGHKGLINFIKFSQKTKKKFIRHYIQKKIYEENKPWVIVPYPGDHIFKSKFSLPYYAALGITITLMSSIILLFLACYNFDRYMISLSKEKEEKYKGLEIFLVKSVINLFLTKLTELKQFIFKCFIDKSENVRTEDERVTFVYLPDPDILPKFAENLLDCKFDNLEKYENNSIKKYKKMIILLTAACERYDIVVTEWQLDALNDNQIKEIKRIIKGKVYLNIGFDVHTFINRTKHRIVWAGDPDVQALNPLN